MDSLALFDATFDATPEPIDDAAATSDADAPIDADATPLPHAFRPQDWEIVAGKWAFAEDGSVECKGGQLESAIVLKDHWFKDVRVRVEANFDQLNASAGLILRVRGTDRYPLMTSYYQFEWYTPGSHHDKRLSIMSKEAPTFWVQIVSPLFPRPPVHYWFPLEFEARGNDFHAVANGKWVLDGKDAKLQRPGRIGLHVYQPVAVKFRNFEFASLDSKLASQKQ